MLNKIRQMLRRYEMVQPGDRVFCAVSVGADSMALLWAMYLLQDKLQIRLSAAHFNHHLRGAESDGEEAFVRQFCGDFGIPLVTDGCHVIAGEKGLEAAAREARYAFLRTLPGKVATAHTADDNAETVMLHLVRGTGLKGLGGISPVMGSVIRPMLTVTRQEVEAFLAEYHIPHREDSSNGTDQFLRNRLRHRVMPLLKQENPQLAENLSTMALRLRLDEEALDSLSRQRDPGNVVQLREMHPAQRTRALEHLLKQWGVREPEAEHIALAERLVFSPKPSAKADFPGNVTIGRNYNRLEPVTRTVALQRRILPCPGCVELPELGIRIRCVEAETVENNGLVFTVETHSTLWIRGREAGDSIRLSQGSRTLKKLFIDRKIPAEYRARVPVICDDQGILGVWQIGADVCRCADKLPAVQIRFEEMYPGVD